MQKRESSSLSQGTGTGARGGIGIRDSLRSYAARRESSNLSERTPGFIAQSAERCVYIAKVPGSRPGKPTIENLKPKT